MRSKSDKAERIVLQTNLPIFLLVLILVLVLLLVLERPCSVSSPPEVGIPLKECGDIAVEDTDGVHSGNGD